MKKNSCMVRFQSDVDSEGTRGELAKDSRMIARSRVEKIV